MLLVLQNVSQDVFSLWYILQRWQQFTLNLNVIAQYKQHLYCRNSNRPQLSWALWCQPPWEELLPRVNNSPQSRQLCLSARYLRDRTRQVTNYIAVTLWGAETRVTGELLSCYKTQLSTQILLQEPAADSSPGPRAEGTHWWHCCLPGRSLAFGPDLEFPNSWAKERICSNSTEFFVSYCYKHDVWRHCKKTTPNNSQHVIILN